MEKQRNDLSYFYYTCLKRIYRNLHWTDSLFSFAMNEISLEDRCIRYWERYLNALSETTDGQLILEQTNLNVHRTAWINKQLQIKSLYPSKRFVEHHSILKKALSWCTNSNSIDSIPNFNLEDISILANFPEMF
jgi:hypothetical protein